MQPLSQWCSHALVAVVLGAGACSPSDFDEVVARDTSDMLDAQDAAGASSLPAGPAVAAPSADVTAEGDAAQAAPWPLDDDAGMHADASAPDGLDASASATTPVPPAAPDAAASPGAAVDPAPSPDPRPATPPQAAEGEAPAPAGHDPIPPPTSAEPTREGCVYVEYCDYPKHRAGTVCRLHSGCSLDQQAIAECASDVREVCSSAVASYWICDRSAKNCRAL